MSQREPDNVIELPSGTTFVAHLDDMHRNRYVAYKVMTSDKLKLPPGYLIDLKFSADFPLYEHTFEGICKILGYEL